MPAASAHSRHELTALLRDFLASLSPAHAAAVADLLPVLDQWQSGTLPGLPPQVPAPSPHRLSSHIP